MIDFSIDHLTATEVAEIDAAMRDLVEAATFASEAASSLAADYEGTRPTTATLLRGIADRLNAPVTIVRAVVDRAERRIAAEREAG